MENRVEVLRRAINELVISGGCGVAFPVSCHMHAVSVLAAMLARKRGLDPEIATMAGLLHDIHTALTGNPEKHAKHGSLKAGELLSSLGIATGAEMGIICTAIRNHSKKEASHDEYSELLKDADVLEHYFCNTTLPVIEKDRGRLGRLFAELNANA